MKMLKMPAFAGFLAVSSLALLAAPSHAQLAGSIDNFDVVNDTGETAEGFEVEMDDVSSADVNNTFPSRFTATPYVQRYGEAIITNYDNTASGGKKGVRITWAATWDGAKWVAKYGSYSSNGTSYAKNPPLNIGDSCWLLGQGAGYATSGCDHFGISLNYGKYASKTSYHWLVPNPAATTTLMQAPWKPTVPASPYIPAFPPAPPVPFVPGQVVVPPAVQGAPPVIHVVAEAPDVDPAEPQFGEAFWDKTYTSVAAAQVNLDDLQKNKVPLKNAKGKPKVTITWALLQRPPAGVAAEKEGVQDVPVAAGNAGIIQRHEYYRYNGVYDPDTREAICAPELPNSNGPCTSGPRNYTYTDPVTGLSRKVHESGKFIGAHMNGFNLN